MSEYLKQLDFTCFHWPCVLPHVPCSFVCAALKWNVNFDPLKERSETAHTRTSTKLLPATSALNEVFGIPARFV